MVTDQESDKDLKQPEKGEFRARALIPNADRTVPEASDRSVVFIIGRANDECEAVRAHRALDCGIFLDGKVANLVQIYLSKLAPA